MDCKDCKNCEKLTNELKGLRMQNGKLKKQASGKKDIPNLEPYISKVDRLKNIADNIGDDELIKAIGAELNNFKTLFQKLIQDVAA